MLDKVPNPNPNLQIPKNPNFTALIIAALVSASNFLGTSALAEQVSSGNLELKAYVCAEKSDGKIRYFTTTIMTNPAYMWVSQDQRKKIAKIYIEESKLTEAVKLAVINRSVNSEPVCQSLLEN